MRRKVSVVVLVGLLAFATSGCGCITFFMWRSHGLSDINAVTQTRYIPHNYEALGTVQAVGEGMCILGVYSEGRDGEALLWDRARAQFGNNFTGIKDIASWTEHKCVLGPIFQQYRTTYVGTVIRDGGRKQ